MKRLLLSMLLIGATTTISAETIESTAEKSHYYAESGVYVKRLDKNKTGVSSAAKLTWNEGKDEWQRQIVLYKGLPNGTNLDKQLNYVITIKKPDRKGSKKWEEIGRKNFK